MKRNVSIDLSNETEEALLSNQAKITGVVIRGNKGKIIKHEKIVPYEVDENYEEYNNYNEEYNNQDVNHISEETAEVLGTFLGDLTWNIIKNVGSKVINHFKDKQNTKIQKIEDEFHQKLKDYIEETKKGDLQVKTIESLIASINELEKKDNNVKIELTTEEFKVILNSIIKFNNENETKEPELSDGEANIIRFKEFLTYQKEILRAS